MTLLPVQVVVAKPKALIKIPVPGNHRSELIFMCFQFSVHPVLILMSRLRYEKFIKVSKQVLILSVAARIR